MTRPARATCSCILLAASCAQEDTHPRSLDDVLDAFVEDVGLSFTDCGGGDVDAPLQIECGGGVEGAPDAAFQAASACFFDSWSACRPARVQLTWGWGPMWYGHYENTAVRTMFVVPQEDDPEEPCGLVVFESDRAFRASTIRRQACNDLLESGACSTPEPQMCTFVEMFHIDQQYER